MFFYFVNIKKVKDQTPVKLCGGKSVKKMADGGIAGTIGDLGNRLYTNVMGTPAQNAAALAREQARKKAAALAAMQGAGAQGIGQAAQDASSAASMPNPQATVPGVPAQKRGGKVKGRK